VYHGLATPEPLLESYSTERSEIARQVLRDSGRLTTVATLRGSLVQTLRNHAASLALRLAPVQRAIMNTMAEISVGYPNGPLNRAGKSRHSAPAAGERASVATSDGTVGSGNLPRYLRGIAICWNPKPVRHSIPMASGWCAPTATWR
jgi:hypothetical protein